MRVIERTQSIPPKTLKSRKRRYSMFAMPATIGAKVRTIGMKRARTIVLPPCFS